MYKSEFQEIVTQLVPVSGGAIEQLIALALAAQANVDAAVGSLCTSPVSQRDSVIQGMKQALGTIVTATRSLSPTAAVLETNQLRERYQKLIESQPESAATVRIGLELLAEFSGAFDVLLQERGVNRVPGVVKPLIEFARYQKDIQGVRDSLALSAGEVEAGELIAILEIDGIETLAELTAWIGPLQLISEYVETVVSEGSIEIEPSQFRVVQIESGSPIRLTLSCGREVMLLFIGLMRDAVRTPYRMLSKSGRLRDYLELVNDFKAAGIAVPEAESELAKALMMGVSELRRSMENDAHVIRVNGSVLRQDPRLDAMFERSTEADAEEPKQLSGPE